MTARIKTVYVCQECGHRAPVWNGRCPSCLQWNTLIEETVERSGTLSSLSFSLAGVKPVRVAEIPEVDGERFKTGIDELDRILGNGVFKGSLNLIGGEPGIGKSTLMLQLAGKLGSSGKIVLYATGEESENQIADRARRLGILESGILILATTSLPDIEHQADSLKPDVLIVDSIQTIFSHDLSSAPGSVSQVRFCAGALQKLTKTRGITTFLIGHVTKEGAIAGPKVLEHLVDSVVYFEGDGAKAHRLLRSVKNRFGSTNELGIFEMTSSGLTGISDTSRFFLGKQKPDLPGCIIVAIIEGSRPFLVEIQALTTPTRFGYPQRSASGFDSRRLSLLLAVLEKRCSLQLGDQDVYINVAGGARISDPGSDLGVCLAIASSFLNHPVRKGVVVTGEIGLGGEVRPVSNFNWRLKETLGLGFSILAGSSDDAMSTEGCQGYEILSRAIENLLEAPTQGGCFS